MIHGSITMTMEPQCLGFSVVMHIFPQAARCNGVEEFHAVRHKRCSGILISTISNSEKTMNAEQYLFVGVKKRVLAIDQRTGSIAWQTELEGSAMGDSFVNVFFDGGNIFAHSKGELFCLNPETGAIKWHNPLEGCGFGIATMGLGLVFALPLWAASQLFRRCGLVMPLCRETSACSP